jgi:hypothetical protein
MRRSPRQFGQPLEKIYQKWEASATDACPSNLLGAVLLRVIFRLTILPCIMKNDADGMAHAGANTADTMPQIDPIIASPALDRPIMDRECDGIALA